MVDLTLHSENASASPSYGSGVDIEPLRLPSGGTITKVTDDGDVVIRMDDGSELKTWNVAIQNYFGIGSTVRVNSRVHVGPQRVLARRTEGGFSIANCSLQLSIVPPNVSERVLGYGGSGSIVNERRPVVRVVADGNVPGVEIEIPPFRAQSAELFGFENRERLRSRVLENLNKSELSFVSRSTTSPVLPAELESLLGKVAIKLLVGLPVASEIEVCIPSDDGRMLFPVMSTFSTRRPPEFYQLAAAGVGIFSWDLDGNLTADPTLANEILALPAFKVMGAPINSSAGTIGTLEIHFAQHYALSPSDEDYVERCAAIYSQLLAAYQPDPRSPSTTGLMPEAKSETWDPCLDIDRQKALCGKRIAVVDLSDYGSNVFSALESLGCHVTKMRGLSVVNGLHEIPANINDAKCDVVCISVAHSFASVAEKLIGMLSACDLVVFAEASLGAVRTTDLRLLLRRRGVESVYAAPCNLLDIYDAIIHATKDRTQQSVLPEGQKAVAKSDVSIAKRTATTSAVALDVETWHHGGSDVDKRRAVDRSIENRGDRIVHAIESAELDSVSLKENRDVTEMRLRAGLAHAGDTLSPSTSGSNPSDDKSASVVRSTRSASATSPLSAQNQILKAEERIASSRGEIQLLLQDLFRHLQKIDVRNDDKTNLNANKALADQLASLLINNGLAVRKRDDDVIGVLRWGVGGKAGKSWRFTIHGRNGSGDQAGRTFGNDFSTLEVLPFPGK